MTRAIVGILDARRRADGSRLAVALAPAPARSFEDGPLRVSYDGAQGASASSLCLLDGHLDNEAELADDLGAAPETSTEELLRIGYRRWGEGLPARLRGDFALLVWDGRRAEGLLARDHLGVRSIYLHEMDGALYFATEIRHLLGVLARRPGPDPAGVAHWLAASSRPDSGTLFTGIRRLAPGCLIGLTAAGATEHCYWRPEFVEPERRDELESAREVHEAIACAVRRRLAPDGLTAVMMSGGLDSASVAAIASREAPGRVEAYSGVFPEHPRVDESQLIATLRTELGLGGASAEIRSGGLLASALESQREWQLPLLSWGDFWTLPLLRAAAERGASVVLGGDGGDELFDVRAFLLTDRLRRGDARGVLDLARDLPGAGERPPRRELYRAAVGLAVGGALPYALHEMLRRPRAARGRPAWLNARTAAELAASDDPLAWKRLAGPRWWANAAHGLSRGIEATGVLELHRHRAALAGLQARHPLLDLDLVELVLRQPPESSFDRHLNRPVLRAAVAGLLPDTVRLRANKALFDSLVADTLAGPDAAAVRTLLADRRAELGAYVELDTVRRELLESSSTRSSTPFRWIQQVWRLTTAECWLRAQADPGGERPLDASQRVAACASPARVRVRRHAPARIAPPTPSPPMPRADGRGARNQQTDLALFSTSRAGARR